ncbi:MAG: GNAT family N-acetyltransferase [Acidimicrobiia bacterium]
MNIHVGSGDTWIMTAWVGEDAMAERATCDVAKIGDDWLITRVLVVGARGRGIGSQLLQAALQEAARLGAKRVIVAPGGYEGDTERQFNFYMKNGFKPCSEPEGALEWKP